MQLPQSRTRPLAVRRQNGKKESIMDTPKHIDANVNTENGSGTGNAQMKKKPLKLCTICSRSKIKFYRNNYLQIH